MIIRQRLPAIGAETLADMGNLEDCALPEAGLPGEGWGYAGCWGGRLRIVHEPSVRAALVLCSATTLAAPDEEQKSNDGEESD